MQIAMLEVKRRSLLGSAASRRARRAGRVPAVLYGHGEEVIPLDIEEEVARRAVESGRHMVALRLDNAEQRALIKDVQFDTFGRSILHMDFARVALDERVTVTVSLVLHGTPKDVANGALMEHPVTSLEIECRADSIPDDIRVEVGHLHVNEMIHVRDLVVPGGIRVLSDPENVVAVLHPPKLEEAVAEAPPAEVEQAEPELIRREEKEEEEGEEERK